VRARLAAARATATRTTAGEATAHHRRILCYCYPHRQTNNSPALMEALMLGVSGMRGTVGGTLTPPVAMRLPAALAVWLRESRKPKNGTHFRVVFGRDSRPSGPWVRDAAV